MSENNKLNNKLKSYEKLQEKFDSLELENMKFEQEKKREKIRWDSELNKNII